MNSKLKSLILNAAIVVSVFLLSGNDAKCTIHPVTIPQDSIELTKLVRQYLIWSKTNYDKRKAGDFWAITAKPTDTLYSGIDWDVQGQNVKAMEASTLFTKGFIDNYQAIAKHIDSKLKSRKIVWHVGDMPDFEPGSGDANPWCNCQDYPDNYVKKISIKNLEFTDDNASFNWTWENNFLYHVKAKKINGYWKIDFLQGFDMKDY